MNVQLAFQSPDFSVERNGSMASAFNEGFQFEAAAFDLDHDNLTVYPRGEELDENLTIARKAPFMNESGEECGLIGWVVAPEERLLAKFPELAGRVGQRYGRVIVVPVA